MDKAWHNLFPLCDYLYKDMALPTLKEQTISPPSVNALKAIFLDAPSGGNVLEVGSGTGFLTTLLKFWVGRKGKVTAMERIEELSDIGRVITKRLGYTGIEFITGNASRGCARNAPYDAIAVCAMADETLMFRLLEELAVGGRMIIPLRERQEDSVITLVKKNGPNHYNMFSLFEARYVPFIYDRPCLFSGMKAG